MDSLMNRLQPVGVYVVLLALFLAALVAGLLYFLFGISDTRYLVTDGIRLSVHYIDKPKYDSNLQGLIFSISFLVAGLLMVLFILLPDRQAAAGLGGAVRGAVRGAGGGTGGGTVGDADLNTPQSVEPPQPLHRAPPEPASGPAPGTVPPPDPTADTTEAQEPPAQSSPLTIEAAGEKDPEPPPRTVNGLGGEKGPGNLEDLPDLEDSDVRYDEDDDDDVVYGEGHITEDAAFDFVKTYPDSAVKFLYRKNLDNKPLAPSDEDIYRNWEMRGLTRQKVREFVLEIMGWHSLPDAFPHQIWKELRDRIFDFQAKK